MLKSGMATLIQSDQHPSKQGKFAHSYAPLWRRKWQPTPVFLPGKPHGQRSLAGYSPWGRKESDMTEQRHLMHCLQAEEGDLEPNLPEASGGACLDLRLPLSER